MFTIILWNVITVSLRQAIIPDRMLGRVNSVYRFFGWGVIPIGALVGGLLVAGLDGPLSRDRRAAGAVDHRRGGPAGGRRSSSDARLTHGPDRRRPGDRCKAPSSPRCGRPLFPLTLNRPKSVSQTAGSAWLRPRVFRVFRRPVDNFLRWIE